MTTVGPIAAINGHVSVKPNGKIKSKNQFRRLKQKSKKAAGTGEEVNHTHLPVTECSRTNILIS